jgi:hypothetical protein
VSDITKYGARNYIEIYGASGQVPLFINGAQGSGGGCGIFPDASGVQSSLNLGSSGSRTNTITISEPVAGTSVVKINGSGPFGIGNAVQIAGGTVPSVSTDFGTLGTLNIGSSSAFPNTLVVSDVNKNGANNYILVNGSGTVPPQVPLFISGSQGDGGASYIFPDSSGVNSALFLGASRNTAETVAIQQAAEVSFVDIGGNRGQGVRLRGSTAGALVQTGIISSTAGASGQLQLQGSSGSGNSINITDASAVFDQQIVQTVPGSVLYPAVIVLASGEYFTDAIFFIGTLPPGLYMCMMRINPDSILNGDMMRNLSSGFMYLQSAPSDINTSIVVGGGTFGNGNVSIGPLVDGTVGASSLRLYIDNGTYNISIKMLPLLGVIPNF